MAKSINWSLVLVAALSFASQAIASDKPNVIVILMDDMGYGDLSSTGNKNYQTPHIDSLARDGVALDSFYVCPVCSPTRAEFLTGRYHTRGGVQGVSTGQERLNPEEETIAEVFQSAGYRTALFGKWHNGSQYPYHPNGQGFEEFYGFTSGHWGQYFDPILEHNAHLIRGEGFVADDFTTKMLSFATDSKSQNKPFFAYLAYCVPHSPMQVDRKIFDSLPHDLQSLHHEAKEDINFTRAALAMVKNADDNVGRVLSMLKDTQLENDTIIVFFSDNGPNSFRFNAGMKGRKGHTDEGGVRSPCYIRWPVHLPSGTTLTQLSGAIDLLPTLTDLCGIEYKPRLPLDGISLAKLLTGESTRPIERTLITVFNTIAARTQQHLLDTKGHLYDRVHDKAQIKPLDDEFPDQRTALLASVEAWKQDVGYPLPKDDRPFPVGYPQFPLTRLPARDATLQGNVKRSSKHPNCSYITQWSSPQASVSFPLDVQTQGTYEVTLHYCCPQADVGSRMTLQVGDQKLEFRVSEPFDSPLIGLAEDVVPRPGESLVKDFKPWTIGTLTLTPGESHLILSAQEIPANQALELRWLELRLFSE